jgi:hypothetical protein
MIKFHSVTGADHSINVHQNDSAQSLVLNGLRGPYRVTSPPDQRERRNISTIIGRIAAPVAVGGCLR